MIYYFCFSNNCVFEKRLLRLDVSRISPTKVSYRDIVCYPLKQICRDPKLEQLCGITAVGGFGLSILAQGNGNDFQNGRDLFANVGDKLR